MSTGRIGLTQVGDGSTGDRMIAAVPPEQILQIRLPRPGIFSPARRHCMVGKG